MQKEFQCNEVVSYYIVSSRSCRIVLYRITSHRIVSYHIVPCHAVMYRIVCATSIDTTTLTNCLQSICIVGNVGTSFYRERKMHRLKKGQYFRLCCIDFEPTML